MSVPKFQVKIERSDTAVFLTINGQDYELSPYAARQMGEVLFKTGSDVAAQMEAKETK